MLNGFWTEKTSAVSVFILWVFSAPRIRLEDDARKRGGNWGTAISTSLVLRKITAFKIEHVQ